MNDKSLLVHPWNVTPARAIEIQQELRKHVCIQNCSKEVRLIGGADISFNKFSDIIYAGIIVLKLPELTEVCRSVITDKAEFPYIPGLLSFREIPSVMKAWEKLEIKPDVMMMDGHGIAHPRRFGIASHFGVLTGIPAFGCAKSLLTGKYEEPGTNPGDFADLIDKSEKIGAVTRTKKNTKPVFVSPGNHITLEECIQLTLRSVTKYRIPEPTRQAHLMVNQIRTADKNQ